MPRRKAAMAAAGVAALGAAAFLLPRASASQEAGDDGRAPGATGAARTLRATDAPDLDARLRRLLGDAFAGSYYDSGRQRLVVNVAGGDGDVIGQAKKSGAVVRQVANSAAELRAATRTLRAEAAIPGTSWAVDPHTGKILVTADSTVTGARWDRLRSAVRGLGSGTATLQKSAGTFRPFASGGDALFSRAQGGSVRCSLGFNVTAADGTPAFLTAGHCGVAAGEWSDTETGEPTATVDRATFPGQGDFSLVTYDDPGTRAPSEVDIGDGRTVPIGRAAEATVGQAVLRMGSTTGLHDGRVTGLDATVNFRSETDPGGVDTVTGLIQTDVCAEPGDSGGPLFTQDGGALGLTSGGSGDCTGGGETFFQPVTTALRATGATLGGGGTGDQAGTGDQSGAGSDSGSGSGADSPSDSGASPSGSGANSPSGSGDEAGAGAGGDPAGGDGDSSAPSGASRSGAADDGWPALTGKR
ncbi:protease [Streptomyces rubradiris]|uniref:Protease n=2 Tax=Streptomyces rubradiris TaxID=285531 RepID=A0ABQ3RC10_STRRR|nr:protease [Streptomyces rubradiris]GHI53392.1 protease [Streptomyces rubradiris]